MLDGHGLVWIFLFFFGTPLRIGRTGDRVAVVTDTDGWIKRTGYIWDHYALTNLYALDEKQAMAKKQCFVKVF